MKSKIEIPGLHKILIISDFKFFLFLKNTNLEDILQGRVEQIGNHEQLLRQTEGTYAKLVQRQMMGDDKKRKPRSPPAGPLNPQQQQQAGSMAR